MGASARLGGPPAGVCHQEHPRLQGRPLRTQAFPAKLKGWSPQARGLHSGVQAWRSEQGLAPRTALKTDPPRFGGAVTHVW